MSLQSDLQSVENKRTAAELDKSYAFSSSIADVSVSLARRKKRGKRATERLRLPWSRFLEEVIPEKMVAVNACQQPPASAVPGVSPPVHRPLFKADASSPFSAPRGIAARFLSCFPPSAHARAERPTPSQPPSYFCHNAILPLTEAVLYGPHPERPGWKCGGKNTHNRHTFKPRVFLSLHEKKQNNSSSACKIFQYNVIFQVLCLLCV